MTPAQYSHGTIPAQAGIGLRSPHMLEFIETRPGIGWVEVHSENYFADGGTNLHLLELVREHYPISLHGVGLSLGSSDPLDIQHLTRLKSLIARCAPGLVSEHLSWSSVAGRYANDLLPLPYTEESLLHICSNIDQTQEFLGRQILIENLSSYLQYAASVIPEWEFISEVAHRTGCGILLDVNNVYISALNHQYDPATYLQGVDPRPLKEFHLAGFEGGNELVIDTHSRAVCAEVWGLYRHALDRFGNHPTLIEWDADIPTLSVLLGEAGKARTIMETTHAVAA